MLKQVSTKFVSEEGEFDVDEDEHGNISIGGTELSFESWAELNRSSEPDIVCSSLVVPQQYRAATVEQNDGNSFGAAMETEQTREKVLKSPEAEKEDGEISDSDSGLSDGNGDGLSATMCHVISSSSRDIYQLRFGIAQSLSYDQKLMLLKLVEKSRQIDSASDETTSVSDVQNVFKEIYVYRFQVVEALSVQQKSVFLDIIKSKQAEAAC